VDVGILIHVGGRACVRPIILNSSCVACEALPAQSTDWPLPDTVSVSIDGRPSGPTQRLVETLGRPVLTTASSVVVQAGDSVQLFGQNLGFVEGDVQIVVIETVVPRLGQTPRANASAIVDQGMFEAALRR